MNNLGSGIDILLTSKFSSVIAVGPSTLNYYAKLFGLNVIDLTNEISITNNEIKSKINEMNESINNSGKNHQKNFK